MASCKSCGETIYQAVIYATVGLRANLITTQTDGYGVACRVRNPCGGRKIRGNWISIFVITLHIATHTVFAAGDERVAFC